MLHLGAYMCDSATLTSARSLTYEHEGFQGDLVHFAGVGKMFLNGLGGRFAGFFRPFDGVFKPSHGLFTAFLERPQIVLDCPRLPFLCQKGDGGRGNDVNISQIMRIFVQLRIRVRA